MVPGKANTRPVLKIDRANLMASLSCQRIALLSKMVHRRKFETSQEKRVPG
jgi:hypothetical protein